MHLFLLRERMCSSLTSNPADFWRSILHQHADQIPCGFTEEVLLVLDISKLFYRWSFSGNAGGTGKEEKAALLWDSFSSSWLKGSLNLSGIGGQNVHFVYFAEWNKWWAKSTELKEQWLKVLFLPKHSHAHCFNDLQTVLEATFIPIPLFEWGNITKCVYLGHLQELGCKY